MSARRRTLIVATSVLVGLAAVLIGSFFFAFRDDELTATVPPVAGAGLCALAIAELVAGIRVGLTNRGAALALALLAATLGAVAWLFASVE